MQYKHIDLCENFRLNQIRRTYITYNELNFIGYKI